MKKITDQRCAVYFVSGKEVSFTHSGLLVKLTDVVWRKIDKHTGLLFLECAVKEESKVGI